jgi:hypothetical protein
MSGSYPSNMQSHQQGILLSQHPQYSNGHPNKKRRSTIPTNRTQAPSLPTPTSATHPPTIHESRPSNASASDMISISSPRDTISSVSRPTASPNLGSLYPTNFSNTGNTLPFSPNFSFSPLPQFASLAPSPVSRPANLYNQDYSNYNFDPMLSMPTPHDQQPTPGAGSTSGASVHTDPDSKDPFLSLLEQLAENEVSRGGPSELDFFLGGQSG